jgi:putative chitinase
MGHPEWLAQMPGALKSAMWYWGRKGLNKYADRGDFSGLTKAVNGGYNGLEDRKRYYEKARKEFGL